MTADDPFLCAVLDAPDDDLCRRIYADALDAGDCPGVPRDAERAEFIRAQVELAQVPADLLAMVDQLLAEKAQGASTLSDSYGPDGCQVAGLRRRERELWKANWLAWIAPVCRACGVERQSVFAADGEDEVCTHPASRWRWRFRRGFVSEAATTAADWLANADALLAACPVRGKRYDEEPHYREPSRDGLVRLTTWPELFMVVGEQSVSLTASNDFRVRPGIAEIRLLDDGHVCAKQIEPKMAAVRAGDYSRAELVRRALAAEWPGVRFEFPPAARPDHPGDDELAWNSQEGLSLDRGISDTARRLTGTTRATDRTARLTDEVE